MSLTGLVSPAQEGPDLWAPQPLRPCPARCSGTPGAPRSPSAGASPRTTRTHCPRRSTAEGRGFFACLDLGGGAQVGGSGSGVNGGSGQRGSQRRPAAEPSPGLNTAKARGWPRPRGGAGGPSLSRAPLSGRTCSAASSPATLGSAARPPLRLAGPAAPVAAAPPARCVPVARRPELPGCLPHEVMGRGPLAARTDSWGWRRSKALGRLGSR